VPKKKKKVAVEKEKGVHGPDKKKKGKIYPPVSFERVIEVNGGGIGGLGGLKKKKINRIM